MKRAIFAALISSAAVWWFSPGARPGALARDFNAFYCAGAAVRSGADPYRAEPLATCERSPKGHALHAVPPNLALPAPLPPFDLAAFAVLSRLSYARATVCWSLLVLLSLLITIEGMHRLTALPRAQLALVFVPTDGISALFLGEVAPVAVASLVLAMLAVRSGRPRVAAVAIALSLCEPHVGVAPIFALFLCFPAARTTTALCACALAVVSLLAIGAGTSLEYVRDVLPAHALSEISSPRQLSLTALLHSAGASDGTALALGTASYLTMLFLGMALSRRLALRDPFDPFIVAAPAALVLVGGAFIHTIQMPAALPAALLAYARLAGRARRIAGAAIVTIAIPWTSFLGLGTIFVLVAAVAVGLLMRYFLAASQARAVAGAFAAGAFVYGLNYALASGDPFPAQIVLPPLHPNDLAEVNWRYNILALSRIDRIVFDVARMPAWIAIATVARGIWLAARRSEPRLLPDRRTIRFGTRAPSRTM